MDTASTPLCRVVSASATTVVNEATMERTLGSIPEPVANTLVTIVEDIRDDLSNLADQMSHSMFFVSPYLVLELQTLSHEAAELLRSGASPGTGIAIDAVVVARLADRAHVLITDGYNGLIEDDEDASEYYRLSDMRVDDLVARSKSFHAKLAAAGIPTSHSPLDASWRS